jgi:hypothetical protein
VRDRRRARRGSLRAENERLAARRRPHDRGEVAARSVQVRLDDLQRETHRDGGIEGVPALLEHGHAGGGREPVGGRDHSERATELGARGEHGRGR